MNKVQALCLLAEFAFKADLPKGLTGIDARMYVEHINTAITTLKALIKED